MAVGSFCLVLHGHLPYVLRHGLWPHGEDWLYEAAAETYLPLLGMIDECAGLGVRPHVTVGLTPVLLEQLAHEDFKRGFEKYMLDRLNRAKRDRDEFHSQGNPEMAKLAERWIEWYGSLDRQFQGMTRDVPGAFAERARSGLIQMLASAATHPYLPLLYEDSGIRAQLRAGLSSTRRILGFQPQGLWLPECGYRGGGPWQTHIGWAGKDNRFALDQLAADEGLTHFFVEHHLIERSNSELVLADGRWRKVDWQEAVKYPGRGWRSVHEPHGVSSDGSSPPRMVAFARDPQICQQVWSGKIGYPANGVYLEFHKRWGQKRGLRYWRVTATNVDLGQKHLYEPHVIAGKIHEQARHFCQSVRQRLWEHHRRTGRHGLVAATFDAELFGHWWFEGPQFLRDVILTLNAEPDVELTTPEEFLRRHPVDKAVSMPAGSWGENGDHTVWAREKIAWMWEIEYRCEALFGKLTYQLPWRQRKDVRDILRKAGRELLLLQASDWPFAVSRGQAVDYGIKRFMLHVGRFETLAELCEKLAEDSAYLGRLTELEKHEVKDADLHDVVFSKVDLDWWNM